MTRAEEKLHAGAELHLPGSGDACVAVYRCAKTLRMATTLNVFLLEKWSRSSTMLDMREQVNDFASTRPGPKDDRHTVAVESLDILERLASEATEGQP